MKKNIFIQVDYRYEKPLSESYVKNEIIELEIDGKKLYSLVKEIQKDRINSSILHVDFMQISLSEEVDVEVALALVGESNAVKNLGCTLVVNKDRIKIRCKASEIPEKIEADISTLNNPGDYLKISDLHLPNGVLVLEDESENIVTVVATEAEEIEKEENEVAEKEASSD